MVQPLDGRPEEGFDLRIYVEEAIGKLRRKYLSNRCLPDATNTRDEDLIVELSAFLM